VGPTSTLGRNLARSGSTSCALTPCYRAVDESVKLALNWPIRTGIPSSEHSARQRETWKADALPTELLPPVSADGSAELRIQTLPRRHERGVSRSDCDSRIGLDSMCCISVLTWRFTIERNRLHVWGEADDVPACRPGRDREPAYGSRRAPGDAHHRGDRSLAQRASTSPPLGRVAARGARSRWR
jgi:hypothetical protein